VAIGPIGLMTIDRGLGEPLPHQQPNHIKLHPINEKFSLSLPIKRPPVSLWEG